MVQNLILYWFLSTIAHESVKEVFVFLQLLLSNTMRLNKFLLNGCMMTPVNKSLNFYGNKIHEYYVTINSTLDSRRHGLYFNNISPSWFWLNIARSPLVHIGTMEYLGPHEELIKLVGM